MTVFDRFLAPLVRAYFRTKGADIASTAHVAFGSRLTRHTSVGANTWINGPAICKGGGRVDIGAHCAVGRDLLVTTTDHAMRHPNMMLQLHWRHGFVDLHAPADVTIGAASWIADRVTLLPGVKLGIGTVVAAGAVVTRGEYPDYAVLAGVPARVVKLRAEPDVARVVADARWWTWPDERIARNRAFFETDLGAVGAAELAAVIRA